MARDLYIHGEALVTVKGARHTGIANVVELGLSTDQITVTPRFKHKEMRADDFGPDIPADVIANLADATVRMTLVSFDDTILDVLMAETLGGYNTDNPVAPGTLYAGAGKILGGYNALYTEDCHYFSVGLTQTAPNGKPVPKPWRFPACYLTTQPLTIPLGTTRSLVELEFRAIPYAVPPTERSIGTDGQVEEVFTELVSSGAVVWDYQVLI